MKNVQVILNETDLLHQQFEIRPLTKSDTFAYFALRQKIKSIGDGRYFSDSYTREAELITQQQQRDWCVETHEHCIIGAFANKKLCGIVMITQFGPPEDSTVEWEASWVAPQYRHSGLTEMLYKQVQKWTVDQGYAFVKVFIRADNTRWLDIRRRQGFIHIGIKRNELWADGTYGDSHSFMLNLHAERIEMRRKQVLHYLEEDLSSLQEENFPMLEQDTVIAKSR